MSGKGFTTAAILLISILVLGLFGVFILNMKPESSPRNDEVACTLEAKICPDGTSVGRVAPDCDYAPCPNASPSAEAFEATFEIYTNGTKRIFTSEMYHNQSEEVFIGSSDPSVVNVARAGITWQDFFDTLPFQIDKECLHTGTSQTFCADKDGRLMFFLNGEENPNALDLPILPNSELVVRYEVENK